MDVMPITPIRKVEDLSVSKRVLVDDKEGDRYHYWFRDRESYNYPGHKLEELKLIYEISMYRLDQNFEFLRNFEHLEELRLCDIFTEQERKNMKRKVK